MQGPESMQVPERCLTIRNRVNPGNEEITDDSAQTRDPSSGETPLMADGPIRWNRLRARGWRAIKLAHRKTHARRPGAPTGTL